MIELAISIRNVTLSEGVRREYQRQGRAVAEARLDEAKAVRRRYRRYVPKRKGELGRSAQIEHGQGRTRVVVRAPHAAIYERGSRPHTITPRRASVLRFTVRGRVVFARSVKHPGTKAYRPMARAMERSRFEFAPRILRRIT